MTANANEASYFLSHCEVAALLIDRFPIGDAATRAHVLNAIRMATFNSAGKAGIGHASDGARAVQQTSGKHWHQCRLSREHVIPVSFVRQKVMQALGRPIGSQDMQQLEGQIRTDDERALHVRHPRAWQIASVVREWTLLAWVTADDNQRLRKSGLHKSMPPDWKEGDDRFARYRHCNIGYAAI